MRFLIFTTLLVAFKDSGDVVIYNSKQGFIVGHIDAQVMVTILV